MINVLTAIWALIGIVFGGGILLTMAVTVITLIVCAIAGIIAALSVRGKK
jgi:hypothetical protein